MYWGKNLTFHITFVLDFFKDGERDLVDTVCLVFPLVTNDRPSVDPSRERGQSRCLGPRNFRDRNKQIKAASERKYNLVFTSPEALFGSHRSSISALKKKIQAVFIDEVHCVAKWLVFVFHVTLVSVLWLKVCHLFHQTTSGRRKLSNIPSHPVFLRANNIQYSTGGASRLGVRPSLSSSWESFAFAFLQSTCGKSTLSPNRMNLTKKQV